MPDEVTKEPVVAPRGESVRRRLAEAPGWSAYAATLREVLGAAISGSGAEFLEVEWLFVGEPLPEEHRGLHTGATVRPPQAMRLAEGMAAGEGPYCHLAAAGRLRIEPGWDGALHLFTTPAVAAAPAELRGEGATLAWRDAEPEPAEVVDPAADAADADFWARVTEASERLTLVCEHWADGPHGRRWFRVTPGNTADVARLLRPGSLVRVATEPDLTLGAEPPRDDFTAFVAPLPHGELAHRSYPGGADALSEVTGAGFSLVLPEAALGTWCAVVPDADGVVRGRWEHPGASGWDTGP
jgi:hypothetical protein